MTRYKDHPASEQPVTRVDRVVDLALEAIAVTARADDLELERALIVVRVVEAPAGERDSTLAFNLYRPEGNDELNDDGAYARELVATLERALAAAKEDLPQ